MATFMASLKDLATGGFWVVVKRVKGLLFGFLSGEVWGGGWDGVRFRGWLMILIPGIYGGDEGFYGQGLFLSLCRVGFWV